MASLALVSNPSVPHLGAAPLSRTSPPMDAKATLKQEETALAPSPSQNKGPSPESPPTSLAEESKPAAASEPLAPPPKPGNPGETPDYFSALHNGATAISHEFNPFEQSFGAPSSETPGKTLLPGVAALTSPAIPGAAVTGGYNWQGSLRSGPLSPAMLPGPQQGDYFDSIGRGFPTPNESSLRTGLTPGGGVSMFPAPSPNSQTLFSTLQSGDATPGTIDFHRTAIHAAARNKSEQFSVTSNPTADAGVATSTNNTNTSSNSNSNSSSSSNSNTDSNNSNANTTSNNNNTNMDAQHDATDAANGLFMLAKGAQANNQFAVANQNAQQVQNRAGDQTGNGSVDLSANGDVAESADDVSRPGTRAGRGKKGAKADATPNNRRKFEGTPKGSNKRAKNGSGSVNVDPALEPGDEDEDSDADDQQQQDQQDQQHQEHNANGKKMTDEEKRRNFLERNRVAALKCRQRKKQWLANLQAKVEMFSAENETLNQQVAQLHEEIRTLRTLLMGHKDCPVGHAQGIGQFLSGIQDSNVFTNAHANPYGMTGLPNGPLPAGLSQRT